MEVSITQFRREMFDLVEQAMNGIEVWVVHNGQRFKIVPEKSPGSRLSRITPLEVINPESSKADESKMRDEMVRAWQKDWSTL